MHQWISATTVDAPAWLIRLHAEYMRLLGAARSVYFIDRPERYDAAELAGLADVATIQRCDPDYWARSGGRPARSVDRQLLNIGVARSLVPAQWILHIDIDEFPHLHLDVGRLIAGLPPEVCEIRLQNAERLLVRGGPRWHDGVLRMPNFDRDLQRLHYGARAAFLGAGLANYFHGKSFVVNRPHVIQGIHGGMLKMAGKEMITTSLEISKACIVHYPCICPQHFMHRASSRTDARTPRARKFIHEHLLEKFMYGADTSSGSPASAVLLMHTCTAAEARAWIDAGLCSAMPESFGARMLSAAASKREVLDLRFADQSFRDFYARG